AAGATGYRLDLGRTSGGGEYGSIFTSSASTVVTNLPCDGSTVYARLWTRSDVYGNPKDYLYKACTNGAPFITSPTPGTTLPSSSVTFTWTGVISADSYRLSVGTTLGGNDIDLVTSSTTSATINNIPRDRVVYARIVAHVPAGFTIPNDYAYNNTA